MPFFHATDGARLYHEQAGDGPPVLCLSGLTRDARDFDDAAPSLADCRLIRMDYRGRHRSQFTGPDTYTVEQEARDALALLDHLGIARAAILGSSRGGLIAMWLAATARERLTAVAMIDIGPVIEPAGIAAIMGYLGHQPEWGNLAEAARGLPRSRQGFVNVEPAKWAVLARRIYREQPEGGLELFYDPRLRAAVEVSLASAVANAWAAFDALASLPLTVIRGANSDLLSPDTLAEMQRRRPDMIAAEVADRGHTPFLDEPESIAALRAFRRILT